MAKEQAPQSILATDYSLVNVADADIDESLTQLETALAQGLGCAFSLARAIVTRLRTSAKPVEDRLVTAAEGARYLGISPATLHELARCGSIPCVETPGSGRQVIRRFSLRSLERSRSEFATSPISRTSQLS